jgi:UV DNA damage endonuclease
VENDDKASMYSVKDLMYIHQETGIPIVFDEFHHKFCTGDLSEEEAIELAITTWPKGIRPEVHYSESRLLYDTDKKVKPQAHSDYVENLPISSKYDVDIMLECKMKELAVIKLRNKYNL